MKKETGLKCVIYFLPFCVHHICSSVNESYLPNDGFKFIKHSDFNTCQP
jgi:hypothetical protein